MTASYKVIGECGGCGIGLASKSGLAEEWRNAGSGLLAMCEGCELFHVSEIKNAGLPFSLSVFLKTHETEEAVFDRDGETDDFDFVTCYRSLFEAGAEVAR